MQHLSAIVLLLAVLGVVVLALPLKTPNTPSSANSEASKFKNIIWADDGIVNPDPYYQRYRRAEWPANQPFFQWWYFYLSDFVNNQYFFIEFGIDDTHMDTGAQYFQFTFGEVNAANGSKWQKSERFDISVVSVDNYFDLKATDSNGELMYHLEVVNNDTFRLFGVMNHTADIFYSEGIDPNTFVAFDVTLSRIHGWFGEPDIETIDRDYASGEIMWNPYSHNSLVEGKVVVGSQTYSYTQTPQFRGYGDMNWGERFPSGGDLDQAQEYPWGWFTANIPNEDPTQDFSFVIGTGKAYYRLLGTAQGSFADFRFNGTHLGIRQVLAWDFSKESFAIPLMATSSDGELKSFSVSRSNYQTFFEGPYNWTVPLCQSLQFETAHYEIVLNYTTTVEKINRIRFIYGDYIFSDFEALGSTVQVVINYFDDNNNKTNLYDFTSDNGGVEFGYETLH